MFYNGSVILNIIVRAHSCVEFNRIFYSMTLWIFLLRGKLPRFCEHNVLTTNRLCLLLLIFNYAHTTLHKLYHNKLLLKKLFFSVKYNNSRYFRTHLFDMKRQSNLLTLISIQLFHVFAKWRIQDYPDGCTKSTYYLVHFLRKLHEIEEILDTMDPRIPVPPFGSVDEPVANLINEMIQT